MIYFPVLNDKEFRIKNKSYCDHLQPFMMLDEQTVYCKNYAYMSVIEYEGYDLDLASYDEKLRLNRILNSSIMALDEGWAIFFEMTKKKLLPFPEDSNVVNPILKEFESDRRDQISRNSYFQSFKYISVLWQPETGKDFAHRLLYKNNTTGTENIKSELDFFRKKIDDLVKDLSGCFKEVIVLKEGSLLSYLSFAATLVTQPIAMPTQPVGLDVFLSATDINTNYPLTVGQNYVYNASIYDFPGETKLDMLRSLESNSDFEFRFVSRFIPYGKERAIRRIKAKQKKYGDRLISVFQAWAQRKGEAPTTVNAENQRLLEDATEALYLISDDTFCFGDLTSTIQVYARSKDEAEANFSKATNIIRSAGFPVRAEDLYTFQCWLSSQPGQCFANCRKQFVNSYNMSHIVGIHSSWNGNWTNEHLYRITGSAYPHMICMSNDKTPFFLNLNVNDVGHTFIAGQTGSGKSTLLCALELEFLRYPQSRVFVFDKDYSAKHLTSLLHGKFYQPGIDDQEEGSTIFQPLGLENTLNDISWGTQWIIELLAVNNFTPTAPQFKEIEKTIKEIVKMDKSQKTLYSFYQLIQVPQIKDILEKYVGSGAYSYIFDGNNSNITDAIFCTFEMSTLISMGNEILLPALSYIFRQIDNQLVPGGAPSMIVFDEAWLFLSHPVFAKKIKEWLKTLRKKNAYVIICTQEIADVVKNEELSEVIRSSCLSRIYLANPNAVNVAESYYRFGLVDTEIYMLQEMVPQREYLFSNPLGSRRFDMCLTKKQLNILRGE